MLDIKGWLETAGEPAADTEFPPGDAPGLPFIAFLDNVKRAGGDMKNLIRRHSLTVERYSETADDNTALEALFDAKVIPYTKDRRWIKDKDCYMTVYDLQKDLIEREDM